MYVIIIGAGRVGTALTRWLLAAEQEVAVIEREPRRCAAIEDALGDVSVLGDALEYNILQRAGASRADALIATGRRDDHNLVICQMAKHLFGVSRVMAAVNVSERVDLFNRLGVDESIDVAALIAEAFEERIGGLLAEDIGGG